MGKPALLVTRRLPPDVEARAAAEFEARLTGSDLPMSDVLAQARGADAILTCPGDTFDAALIAELPPSVKVIATFSVGFDHIDVEAASARGIAVCNTPDVLSVTTAETALLLILAAARRAGEGERLVGPAVGGAGRQRSCWVWASSAADWASLAWAGSVASWHKWRVASA